MDALSAAQFINTCLSLPAFEVTIDATVVARSPEVSRQLYLAASFSTNAISSVCGLPLPPRSVAEWQHVQISAHMKSKRVVDFVTRVIVLFIKMFFNVVNVLEPFKI